MILDLSYFILVNSIRNIVVDIKSNNVEHRILVVCNKNPGYFGRVMQLTTSSLVLMLSANISLGLHDRAMCECEYINASMIVCNWLGVIRFTTT